MSRAGKEHLSVRRVDHDGCLLTLCFVELLSLEIHAGMRAIGSDPRPRNIHKRRIWNGNNAYHTRSSERLPTLGSGLVMRSQGTGDGYGGARQNYGDLPLQVETIKVVIVLFRNVQPVADEYERRLNLRCQLRSQAKVSFFPE